MTRAATAEPADFFLPLPPGYIRQATLPLASLVFLFPFIAIYEVGTRYLTTAAQQGREQQIVAFSKMAEFFRLFGANGKHMPAFAVVGMLLVWHIARKDAWRVQIRTIAGMTVESIAFGLPLLLLAFLVNRYLPVLGLQATEVSPNRGSFSDRFIMDIGAGVYEEFVFRFLLFTFFSLILKDLLKLKDRTVYLVMVLGSGLLFSLYHYWSPSEYFVSRIFAFRTLAGIYFGLIFMCRGFGVTAGCHCAYDIIVTLL